MFEKISLNSWLFCFVLEITAAVRARRQRVQHGSVAVAQVEHLARRRGSDADADVPAVAALFGSGLGRDRRHLQRQRYAVESGPRRDAPRLPPAQNLSQR